MSLIGLYRYFTDTYFNETSFGVVVNSYFAVKVFDTSCFLTEHVLHKCLLSYGPCPTDTPTDALPIPLPMPQSCLGRPSIWVSVKLVAHWLQCR